MTLNVEGAEFDYHTENSEKLTKDFLNFVLIDVPFFALQDELLYLMNKRNITRFRIPSYMTVDSKDHIFYFQLRTVEGNDLLRIYRYLGMDLEKKGLNL
ncbi:TPA: hypothetical protein U0Z15_000232 [Listeria monocytogenes]|uniref:DUF5960 family protein n=1 Tax=Listeria TaxID=1637 RepID=UPI000D653E12|nr:DUF5960 family protein [Listeria monocytogenes]EAG9069382.1 hypothetical protein [Listeria monocytogenes]EIU5744997.1 hypothetical protein [Listeria monocytogenes]EIZ2538743.1 hypothetical protein [Listeria monocytogenes]EIZ2544840.1 hypothetical protein [Listeria monocytogenes]EIZ2825218.1 hypothetical protein [Listeria monocytogenes]